YPQRLAAGENIGHVVPRRPHAALGFRIEGNPTFAAGRRRPTPALLVDQLDDGMCTVAHYRCRAPYGRGHHLAIDDNDPQVLAGDELLCNDAIADGGGCPVGRTYGVGRGKVDPDAVTLLAAGGLDDNSLVLFEECHCLLLVGDICLLCHAQARAFKDASRKCLVVTAAHRYRRGAIAEGLATAHRTCAVAKREHPRFRIVDLHRYSAPSRLVDDKLGLDVEAFFGRRADEQVLVDGGAGLDAVDRYLPETELVVQRNGLFVVVHYRQIHEAATALGEAVGESDHQCLSDARASGLRIDGERPQTCTVVGIIEGTKVVDSHHHAFKAVPAGLVAYDQNADSIPLRLFDQIALPQRHHSPGRVKSVDLGFVSLDSLDHLDVAC